MKAKICTITCFLVLTFSPDAFAQFSGGTFGVQPTSSIVWDSGNSEFQAYQSAVQTCTNSLKATGNEVAFKMCMSDHGFGPDGILLGGPGSDDLASPNTTTVDASTSQTTGFAPRGWAVRVDSSTDVLQHDPVTHHRN